MQKFREKKIMRHYGRYKEARREIETAMVEVNGEAIEERLQYCRSNIFLGETDR